MDQYSVSITGKAIWNRHLNRERDYRRLYALHISIVISVIVKSSSSCFEEVERGYFAFGSNASWHGVKRISITIVITDPQPCKKIRWKCNEYVVWQNYQKLKKQCLSSGLLYLRNFIARVSETFTRQLPSRWKIINLVGNIFCVKFSISHLKIQSFFPR